MTASASKRTRFTHPTENSSQRPMPFGPWNVIRPVLAWIAEQQRRDVAVAEDDLRVAPDQFVVEMRQQAAASPAAADRQHRA